MIEVGLTNVLGTVYTALAAARTAPLHESINRIILESKLFQHEINEVIFYPVHFTGRRSSFDNLARRLRLFSVAIEYRITN